MAQRKFGQILIDLGHINDDQLWDILEEQKQSPGQVIGQVAVRMGFITQAQVTEALAEHMVATLQVSRLQDAINEIVPYQDYLQADKAIIQSILTRFKP